MSFALAASAAEKTSEIPKLEGPFLILVIFCAILLVLPVFLIIWTIKNHVQHHKKQKFMERKYGIREHGTFNHISGLPIASRNPCKISTNPQGYVFQYAAVTYQLPFEKVRDVTVHVDKDTHLDPYRSIVDGNIKADVQKTTSYTLDFIYEDNGVIKQILFSCPSWTKGDPLIKAFYDRQVPQNITL